MPQRLIGGKRLRAGTVASLVDWYVSRGYSDSAIEAAILRKFGKRRLEVGREELRHRRKAQQAGARYAASDESKTIGGKSIPTRTGERATLRVKVVVIFDNPRTKQKERRAYTVDVDANQTKRQMQQEIRSKLAEYEKQHYSDRDVGNKSLNKRLERINVQSIEGL